MIAAPWLWIVFTVLAALGQTVRNAMQRELTQRLGTAGATQIRFIFGFPFAILFLLGVLLVTGAALPRPSLVFWPWLVAGALAQVIATALMLVAMGERSFIVAYCYIKTEPVQVAIFGLIFLGDALSATTIAAIVIATAGVIVMAVRPGAASQASLRPTVMGLISGGMFALSAIGYRGAILSLADSSFLMAATYTLAWGLFAQSAVLTIYLLWRKPAALRAIFDAWRPSALAGFMGATASEFWFLAFALTSAANVRTLGLIEVLFAQLISSYVFRHATTLREKLGVVLVLAGVTMLVLTHA